MSPSIVLRLFTPARRVLVAFVAVLALVTGSGLSLGSAAASEPTAAQVTAQLLAIINADRHAHHLPSLASNPALVRAAATHNALMARYNWLAYRVTGEPALATAFTAAGFRPQYTGEIVGVTTASVGLLAHLANGWYSSAHNRAALLSPVFTTIGINVAVDSQHHKIWLTEDFGRLAAPAPAVTVQTIAAATLAMLNTERAVNHRAALTVDSRLIRSAHAHNLDMARLNTMSHQLPGEPNFTQRIQSAGYYWMNAGENIGWNSVTTTAGVLALESMMYNEKAPDNGHRLNILSTGFRNVGIDVYYDAAHHKIWLTEDFGTLMP